MFLKIFGYFHRKITFLLFTDSANEWTLVETSETSEGEKSEASMQPSSVLFTDLSRMLIDHIKSKAEEAHGAKASETDEQPQDNDIEDATSSISNDDLDTSIEIIPMDDELDSECDSKLLDIPPVMALNSDIENTDDKKGTDSVETVQTAQRIVELKAGVTYVKQSSLQLKARCAEALQKVEFLKESLARIASENVKSIDTSQVEDASSLQNSETTTPVSATSEVTEKAINGDSVTQKQHVHVDNGSADGKTKINPPMSASSVKECASTGDHEEIVPKNKPIIVTATQPLHPGN